jgi:hypothetical protein
MKKYSLLLILICSLCLVSGCGTSAPPPLPMATHFSITTASSTPTAGTAFNITVTALDASNGVVSSYSGMVHFASSDSQAVLPPNSSLTNGTGTFSVTLKTAGSQFITATDTGAVSIKGTSNSITVTTPQPVISTSPAPTIGVVNLAYGFTFTVASGGQAPFNWSETGALPPGLKFNNSTGELSGTPTMTTTASFPITLEVQDSLGQESAPQDFTIQIALHGFKATGSMGTARVGHTATVLGTGKVLVMGGNDSNTHALASYEMFDPSSGTFTAAGNMETARAWHTATLLKSGKVLVTGGQNSNAQALASAELLDPTAGTITKINMVDARSSHTATLLDDGRVLVVGGVDSSGTSLLTAELFDPTTETFASTGMMEAARARHTATLLKSGKVLVTGGVDVTGNSTAEIYDPAKGSFAPTGSMETGRYGHTATLLSDGTVLVRGGLTAELFDPNSGSFTPTTDNMGTSRTDHTATLLKDGTVLIAGGAFVRLVNGNRVLASIASAELYDPANKTFSPTGGLQSGRYFHTASMLNDGTVLVTGGAHVDVVSGQISSTVLSTAEIYK